MRLPLNARISLLITGVAVTTSATVSFILISDHKTSMEREIINRGITMSESLSRAVAEGLWPVFFSGIKLHIGFPYLEKLFRCPKVT